MPSILETLFTGRLVDSLWLGLLTESGEVSYLNYGRTAIPRDASGWTIANNKATNAVSVSWPKCVGGEHRVNRIGIYAGPADAEPMTTAPCRLLISENIRPELSAGNLTISIVDVGAV